MLALSLPAILLQEPVTGLTSSQVNMLMIFAGAVTLAVVIQVAILIAMAVGAAKARKEIVRLTTEIHGKAVPLINDVTAIVQEATPKIKNTIDSVEEIALIARKKAVEIDSLSTEMIMRARQDGRRVDGIVNNTLDKVEHLRETVNHALMAPVRQAAGAIAAIKSGFEKLKENIPSSLQYVAGFVKREPSSAASTKGPYAAASAPPAAAPRSYASATQSTPGGEHNRYGSIEFDVKSGAAAGSSRTPAPPSSSSRPSSNAPMQDAGTGAGVSPRNYAAGTAAGTPQGEHNRYGSIEVDVERTPTNRYGEPAPRRADFNSSREREKLIGEGEDYHA